MQFQEAVKTCFNKYAEFKGRASRSEFWWFVLFYAIANLVANAISDKVGSILAIGLLLPYLAWASEDYTISGKNGIGFSSELSLFWGN